MTTAGAVPASIGAVTPGAAVWAGAGVSVGMAGTADTDTAMSGAVDVRVDIPGWAIPVADGRAAVTPVVIQVEVTPAVVTQEVTAEDTTTNPSCCRPQRFPRWGRFASGPRFRLP
jgi:hypothetical protein